MQRDFEHFGSIWYRVPLRADSSLSRDEEGVNYEDDNHLIEDENEDDDDQWEEAESEHERRKDMKKKTQLEDTARSRQRP